MNELKVIVRVMKQGEKLTDLRIIVNGLYFGDATVVYNRDLSTFLTRLNPDDLQFDGNVPASVCQKTNSDLAALRKSRPDVPKINGELLAACKEFVRKCECGEARSRRSYKQMKAAIRNAKGAQ